MYERYISNFGHKRRSILDETEPDLGVIGASSVNFWGLLLWNIHDWIPDIVQIGDMTGQPVNKPLMRFFVSGFLILARFLLGFEWVL